MPLVNKLNIVFPYLLFAGMGCLVLWTNLDKSRDPVSQAGVTNVLDPVCHMEVNASWGYSYHYEGVLYAFCSEKCLQLFREAPYRFLGMRCMVCDIRLDEGAAFQATYLGKPYFLCSEGHRRKFQSDPASYFLHRMWGIPNWLYYGSIACLLVLSFLKFEGVGRSKIQYLSALLPRRDKTAASRSAWPGLLQTAMAPGVAESPGRASSARHDAAGALALPALAQGSMAARFDLMRFPWIRAMLLSRPFRFSVQASMTAVFLLIIAAGLFGNQNPALNIAPLLTWTIWWGGLVVLIMFVGKAWCYMCPWEAIAFWLEKLRFWEKADDGIGLDMKWPRAVRNISLATLLFVGLTWFELGFGVTMSPSATAYLAVAMLLCAIVSALLFDRKSFCRYGCLVGRVSGLYALFSGIEIRSKNGDVCRACTSKECVKGSETAYGCPTFEYPGMMRNNTYCIQCTECLQACPHDNLAVNLRPWGSDLAQEGRPRSDEAYLALLMLSITGFHGLTMTPVWRQCTMVIDKMLPGHEIFSFSLGMIGLMGLPIAVYAGLIWISYRLSLDRNATGKPRDYRYYFIRYAYCLLPIALFYHLAHNLEHLLMEGPKIIALISDPFGWGWNVFGTANLRVPPMVSLDMLWVIQVILVAVGHVYSLWAAQKISHRMFAAKSRRGQWPMLLGMILFSIFSLWLLKQPMEMRTSAM